METYSVGHPNILINKIGGRDSKKRKDLEKEVLATNQPGAFQLLDSQFFETEFKSGTKCNFPVSLVTYEASITNSKGVEEQKVEKATYMILEPQFEWNKQWLTYTFEKPGKKQGLRLASEPDTYTNTQYFYCLSVPAAHTKTYSNMYIANKKGTYENLTDKDVMEEFHVMKCNWIVQDQTDYNDHCLVMHGIAPAEMRAEENISVNPALPFKLLDAMQILSLGSGDHDSILQDWFNKAIASGLVAKSSNKNSSDIQENRSKEMLNEIIRVTENSFNTRFKLELQKRPTVKGDLKYGFTCKWADIEAAFYAALGKDQAVDRHDSFFKDQYSLGGNTMEYIISEVATTVERCFGKSKPNYTALGKCMRLYM